MTKKKHSTKGYLVKGYVPPISRDFLELDFFRSGVRQFLRGNSGIYALYKKTDLYYVGLANDLFPRLITHTRDKHKNKWDHFSVFIIRRGNYLKDIESMVHRISEPPANVFKGKFKEHYQYDKKIKKIVRRMSTLVNNLKKEESS
ncbi:MAG: hypothetical protein U0R44_01625 [Candidatus Micrarchaeia archaeon]